MLRYALTDDAELQLLQPHHADDLFALIVRNRVHLRRWLPWVDDVRTAEDVRAFCRRVLHDSTENTNVTEGIWFRGQIAGVISVHPIEWNDRCTSIGYWLGEEFQGHGLMTLAVRAILEYLFDQQRLNRVELTIATGNTRSRNIPARLGFTHEGRLRQKQWLYDHFVDLEIYALLREEWDARR